MNILKIEKSVQIAAPKEKVWEVLFNDVYTRQWYAAFHEGAHALTDWKVGSKAIFSDNNGEGIVGTITANKHAEFLSITYSGLLSKGKEDYDSVYAQGVKGTVESYRLFEKKGFTTLEVALDMGEDFYDHMSEAWDGALVKVTELAVKISK